MPAVIGVEGVHLPGWLDRLALPPSQSMLHFFKKKNQFGTCEHMPVIRKNILEMSKKLNKNLKRVQLDIPRAHAKFHGKLTFSLSCVKMTKICLRQSPF
jgi:hypothetical protein